MKEFKPVLIFLLKFIVVWIGLVIIYNFVYLESYHAHNLADPYSQKVANWTVSCLNSLGYEAYAVDDESRPWTWIYFEGNYGSYINEGCNAISIMIIFVAFIVAFSTTWKQTLAYILGGLVLIQIMNVFRICLLNYIIKYHPIYTEIAHDYLFPAIIYGVIVVLWIVWVRYFVMKPNKKSNHE